MKGSGLKQDYMEKVVYPASTYRNIKALGMSLVFGWSTNNKTNVLTRITYVV